MNTLLATEPVSAPGPVRARGDRRRQLAIRAGVLGLVTTAVSLAGSWIPSIWGDEATSILSAQRSLPSLFRMLGHVDAVHGTYYLLLHFWVLVFGASAFSVRVPSAIAVGLAAAGVVVLADRLAGPRVGVLAGILFAILPRTTYMGEEARGYALSAACAVWATILLVRLLTTRTRRRRDWAFYAIAIAGCGYVFLFSLLLVPVHAVIVMTYRRELMRRWMRWLGLSVVIALPVLVYGIAENNQIGFLSDRTAATWNAVFFGQWFGNSEFASLAWGAIALAIGLGIRSWWLDRDEAAADSLRRRTRLRTPSLLLVGAVWLILPMTLLLVGNWVHPMYSSRYLSFAAPAAALTIAWLVGRLRRSWVQVVAILVTVAAVAPTYVWQRTVYAKNSSDWSVDAAYIGAHASVGDGILFDESTRPSINPRLAMAAYPASFTGLKDIALESPGWKTDGWQDKTYPLDDVINRLGGIKTLWVIEHRGAGTSGDSWGLDALVDSGYSITGRVGEYRSVIYELARTG